MINIARVCSIHFSPRDIQKICMDTFMNYSPMKKRKLKFDAIPSKNIPDVTMKVIVFIVLCVHFFIKIIVLQLYEIPKYLRFHRWNI